MDQKRYDAPVWTVLIREINKEARKQQGSAIFYLELAVWLLVGFGVLALFAFLW